MIVTDVPRATGEIPQYQRPGARERAETDISLAEFFF